jgi:hypothetical protein
VLVAVLVASLLALGACNSGGSNDGTKHSRPGATAPSKQSSPAKKVDPHYAVFPNKVPGTGWDLTDAIRMAGTGANADAQLGGLPGVDWYAEFDRPAVGGSSKAYLSLTGYTQSLQARQAESVSPTSNVQQGDINGRPAFWFSDPDDPSNGATVTMAVADNYTIEVFATGLSMDELLALARTVKDATEAEWVAAGGQLTNCAPGPTACPDSAGG